LRLAEAETYPEKATHRVGVMRREFPDAMVTGYEPLIDAMTNDSKDRHVLAATLRADAEIVVTANPQDFPKAACVPYDIDVVHPDDFLLDQLDLYNGETLLCLRELVADRQHPHTPMPAFPQGFRKTVPGFVDAVTPLLVSRSGRACW
jgi:hypothetical protein